MIRKNLRRCITSWDAINETLIQVDLSINWHKTAIVGVCDINYDALVSNKTTKPRNGKSIRIRNQKFIIDYLIDRQQSEALLQGEWVVDMQIEAVIITC